MAQPKNVATRRSRRLGVAMAFLAATTSVGLAATGAHATVVERIVAIVGERPILLSDLRARALPVLLQVMRNYKPGAAQSAAAISDVYRQVLDVMINDELERKAAINANLSVSSKEIDNAIETLARRQKLTPAQLIHEAERSGIPETQFRDMQRRQLLEFKLLQLRVVTQIRITEDELKTAYRAAVMEMRKNATFQLRWIVIHVPRDAAAGAKQRAIGETVAEQARAGADFADLARRYSQDLATASSGGLLPSSLPGKLPPLVDRTALGLEVGETSPPLRVGDDLIVVKVVSRDHVAIPSFEDSRAQLQQEVYGEKMDIARRRWLESLRKRTHVEIRQ